MSIISEYKFYVSETEQIWKEYKDKYGDSFSTDGILNPHVYFESGKLKIMFILMENYNKGSWNIIDKIENNKTMCQHPDNGSKCFAPNILRTLFYVRDNKWVDFFPSKIVSGTGFAYLNLKKHDEGKNKTDYNDLTKNSRDDKVLLKRQIIACCPDIVFCSAAGNYERFLKVMEVKETDIQDINDKSHIIKYLVGNKEKKLLAVQWFHPSHNTAGWSKKAYKSYLDELRKGDKLKAYSRIV